MKNSIIENIYSAVRKFKLNLAGLNVLTEAATGNYVVTPVIAALGGARVITFSKDSQYGTYEEAKEQTVDLAKKCRVYENITIVDSLDKINLPEVDILTNTGFLRPINEALIKRLPGYCVIPYMFEPWEYRQTDIDLDACKCKGIKVYGTNEGDPGLQTFRYIGYTVLYFLLKKKLSPFSAKLLLIGNEEFANPVAEVLNDNGYCFDILSDYSQEPIIDKYNAVIIAERRRSDCLVGSSKDSFIKAANIRDDMFVLHISGAVDFSNLKADYLPENPASFGYMSFNTDFIDPRAVIDLHTAGLKVGEGMVEANNRGLVKEESRTFMEENYPALAFDNPDLW
ncbi:MAG: hypothetical protein R6U04_14260 [Bacteroidales bacterium]